MQIVVDIETMVHHFFYNVVRDWSRESKGRPKPHEFPDCGRLEMTQSASESARRDPGDCGSQRQGGDHARFDAVRNRIVSEDPRLIRITRNR